MNEAFRDYCDHMLLSTLTELEIPHWNVFGTMAERLEKIVDLFSLPVAMPVEEAIGLMQDDYAAVDQRLETERMVATQ